MRAISSCPDAAAAKVLGVALKDIRKNTVKALLETVSVTARKLCDHVVVISHEHKGIDDNAIDIAIFSEVA